jgi:hypothetical protein
MRLARQEASKPDFVLAGHLSRLAWANRPPVGADALDPGLGEQRQRPCLRLQRGGLPFSLSASRRSLGLCCSNYRLPGPDLRRAPCSALSGLSSHPPEAGKRPACFLPRQAEIIPWRWLPAGRWIAARQQPTRPANHLTAGPAPLDRSRLRDSNPFAALEMSGMIDLAVPRQVSSLPGRPVGRPTIDLLANRPGCRGTARRSTVGAPWPSSSCGEEKVCH